MYKGSAEQNVYEAQELPEHLKKMYEDNILELLIDFGTFDRRKKAVQKFVE